MNRFEELEHTADWAFRAHGRTLEELFENAAFALFALEGANGGSPNVTRQVQVQGIDYESLLVNWLSELLYLRETRGETYSRFHIEQLTQTELSATISGAQASPHTMSVKAVTYHDLKIERTAGGWEAKVVLDV